MRTFGMATGPLEDGTGMGMHLQILGGIDLELAAPDDLLGLLVSAEVREVGLHEESIILACPLDTCLLDFGSVGQVEVCRQDQLLALFPLLPFLFAQSVFSHC